MSKYAEVVDGEVCDFKFVKVPHGYNFYVAEHYVGQLFGPARGNRWSIIGHPPHPDIPVDMIYTLSGFASRLDACNALLEFWRRARVNKDKKSMCDLCETYKKIIDVLSEK